MQRFIVVLALLTVMPQDHAQAQVNSEIVVAPQIELSDALGTFKVPITAFCLGPHEEVLTTIAPIKVCVKAKHVGHAYRRCVQSKEVIKTIENKFTYRLPAAPRSSESYIYREYAYGPVVEAVVYDFDPRGGKSFNRFKEITLQRCR